MGFPSIYCQNNPNEEPCRNLPTHILYFATQETKLCSDCIHERTDHLPPSSYTLTLIPTDLPKPIHPATKNKPKTIKARIRHGQVTTFTEFGCRCKPCIEAYKNYVINVKPITSQEDKRRALSKAVLEHGADFEKYFNVRIPQEIRDEL